jgi:hypothetical protein
MSLKMQIETLKPISLGSIAELFFFQLFVELGSSTPSKNKKLSTTKFFLSL